MPTSTSGFRSKFAKLSFALIVLTLWLVLHGYHGITGDGQIYAFQAYARLHPNLATDLFLSNSSQDQFTLFSPFYARCIDLIGLEQAARSLTIVFTLCFLAAAWNFVRALTNDAVVWLAVAFLLIIGGDFGASHAFKMLDPFLTARLPAEALTITALACHLRRARLLGLTLASAALLIHPLMALPGLLLLICMWTPIRIHLIGAGLGVVASLATAVVATYGSDTTHGLTVMDAPWLEVVRERSQFLFLQLWSRRDWSVNALPFLSLAMTAITLKDEHLRKLCAAAAVVGTAGLTLALIGSVIGPVAILVQGQAWRWVWITVFVGAALVPLTALRLWRVEDCGPTCAALLVSGWILSDVCGTACIAIALFSWRIRTHVKPRVGSVLKWSGAAFVVVMTLLTLAKSWTLASRATTPHGSILSSIAHPEDVFALKVLATLLTAPLFYGVTRRSTTFAPISFSAALLACSILLATQAFKQSRSLASATESLEFTDWESVIPTTSTVLVVPTRDVGAFVWFTLRRPNYLALNQSAGVVFSRETALEIRRRSEILLPLMGPDWKLLTSLRAKFNSGSRSVETAGSLPLTAKKLMQVCTDPRLGFIISPANLGFDPIRHLHDGAWRDWNLYDCEKVRPDRTAT